MDILIEFSVFSKDYGILTKEMRLDDGEIIKDASQCRMSSGNVQTASVANLLEFREILNNLNQNQAIALGITEGAREKSLRICKKGLEAVGAISRSREYFHFRDKPTLMLLDYDPPKGGPAQGMEEVYAKLLEIMPELKDCEVLGLGSTSSGIYREGDPVPGSQNGGCHFYVAVNGGSKIPELGKTLAARCWLTGHGRFDISKSGTLLSRSLVDEAVFSPERLIFEAQPALGPGLQQLPRVSSYWPGGVLRTDDVKGLSSVEEGRVETLKLEAKAAKQPEADIVKEACNKAEVTRLVKAGMSKGAAREQVKRANNGVLTGGHPLQFAELPLLTVADVLRAPEQYHEFECLDPSESLDESAPYRAKFFKNEGSLVINTFRGGGAVYKLDKTEIKIEPDNPINVFEQIESALRTGARPDVFIWGGCLAHIGPDGAIRGLTAVTAPIIVGRLVRFYRMRVIKDEWVKERAELPDKLWKAFLEKGSWNVPRLTGIAHAPYFFNGAVVKNRGYHSTSGLYLADDFELRRMQDVSQERAVEALDHLRAILAGFPFESDVDESVAVAMMLVTVQRATLETAPLFAVSATTPGTGKTQLARGIASLMTGDAPGVHGFRDNEQETAKMLMSALLQGSSSLVIDNVKLGVALGGDSLCAVLSSPVYQDRELGYSRIREVSTRALMCATGNNLKLASDVTRRSLMVRLDARDERPELRKFDKSFIQICREQRVPILRSVLTILSAYHEAGRPKVDSLRLGTFEQFSDEICAPLVWLGLDDPALGQAKPEADEGVAGLGELLNIWRHEIGYRRVTVSEIWNQGGVGEWFGLEFDDRNGPSVRKVGRFLAKYSGRVVDGMRIVRAGTQHSAAVWQFELVSQGSLGGVGEFV